jgi:DNA-binding response OmpR family regulator
VLLDLTMPRMGGEETFQELRKIREDVMVVLSSGFSEHEVIGRFAEGGVCGFVQKPYRFEKLVAEVEAAARSGAPGAK